MERPWSNFLASYDEGLEDEEQMLLSIFKYSDLFPNCFVIYRILLIYSTLIRTNSATGCALLWVDCRSRRFETAAVGSTKFLVRRTLRLWVKWVNCNIG